MESYNLILGLVCTLVGLAISYAAFQHNTRKDNRDEGREAGAVLSELGYIKGGIDDLKAENREQRKTNTELIKRVTSVEASAEHAHKRIDRLEGLEERGERE